MLDAHLADRYFLDIETPLVVPTIVVPRIHTGLVDKVKNIKKESKEPKNEVSKEQQEISDAVSKLVEELEIEPNIEKDLDFSEDKKMMYSLLDQDIPMMDYSKLGYGKVAEPLAINYSYSDYEQDEDGKKATFNSTETLTTDEADKIIEQVFLAQRTSTTTGIDPEAKERFAYYVLFNQALVAIKYDQFKSNTTQIDGGAGGNFRYIY